MFCILQFARLTGVTTQSPIRVDQFPIIHCNVASEVGGGGTRSPRILISSIIAAQEGLRGSSMGSGGASMPRVGGGMVLVRPDQEGQIGGRHSKH